MRIVRSLGAVLFIGTASVMGQTPTSVLVSYDLFWHTAAGDTAFMLQTSRVPKAQMVISPTGIDTTTMTIGQPVRVQFEHEGNILSYAIQVADQPILLAGTAYIIDVFSLYDDGTRYGPISSQSFMALAPSGCALVLTPPTLPDGTVGVTYGTITLVASGGTPPYGLTVAGGLLPPGLVFVSGQIAGTPTAAGSFPFTVRASDTVGCFTDQPYTIAITAAPPPPSDTTAPVVSALTVKRTGNTSRFTATVSDAVGVVSVTFVLDGQVIAIKTTPTSGTVLSGTYIASSSVSAGTHTITADARDAAGNIGTRSIGFIRFSTK